MAYTLNRIAGEVRRGLSRATAQTGRRRPHTGPRSRPRTRPRRGYRTRHQPRGGGLASLVSGVRRVIRGRA